MTETLSESLPSEVERLVDQVLRAADAADVSLATAESCTGGLLASVLTDVEGLGHVFERGYVVYTDQAKQDEVGVPLRLIRQNGAVSEPVARAMAEGALRASRAGAAVAITGFAGPAGPGDEPGLVHLAVAVVGQPTRHEEHHFGAVERGACRIACLRAALTLLRKALG